MKNIIIIIVGVFVVYTIFRPSEQSTKKVEISKYVVNKWDDILEYTILKHIKNIDTYVNCKSQNIDNALYTMCYYQVSGYEKKPLFLNKGNSLKAINGTARNKIFLGYDEISEYDTNRNKSIGISYILSKFD